VRPGVESPDGTASGVSHPQDGLPEAVLRPRRQGVTAGAIAKILLLGAVNALALYGLGPMIEQQAWAGLISVVAATVAINWVYLSRKRIALKYLVPGLLFLLAFQVYPVIYNVYIAFTNYGTGNILTQSQAINEIERRSLYTPAEAVRYRATPLQAADGELGLLLEDPDGARFLGTADSFTALDETEVTLDASGALAEVAGFRRLTLRQAQDLQRELTALRVPLDDGEIQLATFTAAVRRDQRLRYDPDRDAVVDQIDGTVYESVGGAFVSAEGARLNPGWRVTVGAANFTRVFTSPAIRGPFVRVFIWTYVFALLAVAMQFAVGLGLAVTLNHPNLRAKRLYRSLLVIPFALPSFMTALVWAGMLNREFGVINQILGAAIPWLQDPTMAKVSIILVVTWLGFPYMFLISTGALQAIPSDLREAAAVDGASAFAAFRRVTFPLLLVSVAPLLIASFAFNFNNFNVVYLLTRGNPPIVGAATPAGHTDILITYTYRLAFEGGRGQDYGFASAISVVIFLMVALISAFSFRFTRQLEELN
jgi:arabinogalactan oligomer / maltooligosaccharide transport system permease protein